MRGPVLALSALLFSCGESPRRIEPSFLDPLAEAPARSLEVLGLSPEVTCRDVLAVAHDDVAERWGPPLFRSSTTYPPRGDDDPLRSAPTAWTLAAAARDAEGRVHGRACQTVDGRGDLSILLRLMPECSSFPALDLVLVMEASESTLVADIGLGESLRDRLSDALFRGDEPADTRYGVRSSPARTDPAADGSVDRARAVLDELSFEGSSELFASTLTAIQDLRDRASCRRRPALVLVASGGVEADRPAPLEVRLALMGAGPADDIPTVGVGLSDPSVALLRQVLPAEDGRSVFGALTEPALEAQLTVVRSDLLNLVDR
jgi:hypothetical protein